MIGNSKMTDREWSEDALSMGSSRTGLESKGYQSIHWTDIVSGQTKVNRCNFQGRMQPLPRLNVDFSMPDLEWHAVPASALKTSKNSKAI